MVSNNPGFPALACLNMNSILVTLLVSQPPMFWLNALASLNMLSMLVTSLVSHLLMSSLNVVLKNILFISVIPVVQFVLGNFMSFIISSLTRFV